MITLTFWGILDNKETFINTLYDSFGEFVLSKKCKDGNVYYTLNDKTTLTLGTPESVNTPEKFQSQLNTLTNYFQTVKTDKPLAKDYVIEQVSGFNIMLGLAFQDNGNSIRLDRILESIFVAADKLNGVILLANRDLLDGKGFMLFSHDGKSNYLDCDIKRYFKSKDILANKSIKFIPKTSLELKESDCKLRSIDEICKRILALFQVSIYSHNMLDNKLGQIDALQKLGDLNDKYNSLRYVTKLELVYLNSLDFDSSFGEQFILRFESLATLLWCIGLIDDLGEADKFSDIHKLSDFICNFESIEKIIVSSNIRDIDEILNFQDLTLRYFLASSHLNFEILRERLIALNWVLTTKFGTDWDLIVDNTVLF